MCDVVGSGLTETVVVSEQLGVADALVYVVRHAEAGQRSDQPDDHLRSLTAPGLAQAQTVAGLFEFVRVGEVLSSPSVRCIETVEPLAARHGRQVVRADALAEGAAIEPLLRLLDHLPAHSVVCTHGDMLHGLIDAIAAAPHREYGCFDKGAVWVLTRADGGLSVVDVIPPAAVASPALAGVRCELPISMA